MKYAVPLHILLPIFTLSVYSGSNAWFSSRNLHARKKKSNNNTGNEWPIRNGQVLQPK